MWGRDMRWNVSRFQDALDNLYNYKKIELTRFIETAPGRPPKPLDRETRDMLIEEAMANAEASLIPMAKGEFESLKSGRPYSRRCPAINANGPISKESWDEIKQILDGFYDSLDTSRQIYIFWDDDACLYVGQTKNDVRGGGGKWQSYLWREASSLQILSTWNRRDLGKFECLAVHIYKPKYNQYKPPIRYYGSKCPVHEIIDPLRVELREMFALKS